MMIVSFFAEKLIWIFGLGCYIIFFLFGATLYRVDTICINNQTKALKGSFEALIVDIPQVRYKTVKLKAEIKTCISESYIPIRKNEKVYVYVATDQASSRLSIGQVIKFNATLNPVKNRGNPDEFDYAQYLRYQGVSRTAYIPQKGWEVVGNGEMTLKMRALKLRDQMVEIYGNLGFEGENLAILSAMTLGDKSDISDELRTRFSRVGASHVLALSGLHVGILFLILSFLFSTQTSIGWRVMLKMWIIILFLWCYAFVAGLSPSLVRATVLFSLIAFGKSLGRDVSSLNSLGIAALAMLLYDPQVLFDVGFQLSFSAVFVILLLTPIFNNYLGVNRHNGVVSYFFKIITVSLAAQIGTLPFVLYYFGNFPILFLATNLIVIPIAFLILTLAILLWILIPIPLLQLQVARLLRFVIESMNLLLDYISRPSWSSFEVNGMGLLDTIVLTMAVTLFFYWIKFRSRKSIVALFMLLVVIFSLHFVARITEKEKPYIVFYNSEDMVAVQMIFSRNRSYLYKSSGNAMQILDNIAKPFWEKEGFSNIQMMDGNFSDDIVDSHRGIISFMGRKIKVLRDESWIMDKEPLSVDCILICDGFKGKIADLLQAYPTKWVLVDASLATVSRRRVQRECKNIDVSCIDITQTGALKLNCDIPEMDFKPITRTGLNKFLE